jgi:hypothetical protein
VRHLRPSRDHVDGDLEIQILSSASSSRSDPQSDGRQESVAGVSSDPMLRQLVVKDEHGHDLRQLQCFSLGIGPLSATSRAADYSIYAVIVYYNVCRNIYSTTI